MAYIEDHSANGTFVNGKRLEKGRRCPLTHSAEIALAVPQNKGEGSSFIPRGPSLQRQGCCLGPVPGGGSAEDGLGPSPPPAFVARQFCAAGLESGFL